MCRPGKLPVVVNNVIEAQSLTLRRIHVRYIRKHVHWQIVHHLCGRLDAN